MKYKIIYMLVTVTELIICLLVCLTDNINKYNSWTEVQAKITDISVEGTFRPVKSSRGTDCFITVEYNDNKELMLLSGYSSDLVKGDVITIKYNPDNSSDIVYIPYEKHHILFKRIKTIVMFFILLILSFLIIEWIKIRNTYYI